MLELYFKYPGVLRRLRRGALGEELDRVAADLSEAGYKRASAKIYLSQLGRFSRFVARRAQGPTIDQRLVDRFMRSLPTASARIAARVAIGHARRSAPGRFSASHCTQPDPDGALLTGYLAHLQRVQGLAPKTCEGLLLGARRILRWYHEHLPGQTLAAMTPEHVLALAQHLLSRSTNHYTRSSITSSVRSFLRFLLWSEFHPDDLARFVPHTPCWRLTHLPPRLTWEELRVAIDAIDVTTPSGARDRAILLLLATTGLRNKELRSLELQDIRWRASEVLVRCAKAKHDRVVPLLQEAGAALAEYVLHARPRASHPQIFLSYAPPVRPFACAASISRIVRSRLEQSGVKLAGPAGAHLLRHSLATQLVRQRRPINEVADLLGHQSIDTTAIYVKVAVPQLAEVALPFPGAVS